MLTIDHCMGKHTTDGTNVELMLPRFRKYVFFHAKISRCVNHIGFHETSKVQRQYFNRLSGVVRAYKCKIAGATKH